MTALVGQPALAFFLPIAATVIPFLVTLTRVRPSMAASLAYAVALGLIPGIFALQEPLKGYDWARGVPGVMLVVFYYLVVHDSYREAAFPSAGPSQPHTVTPGLSIMALGACTSFVYLLLRFQSDNTPGAAREPAGASEVWIGASALACVAVVNLLLYRRTRNKLMAVAIALAGLFSWLAYLAFNLTGSGKMPQWYTAAFILAALLTGALLSESTIVNVDRLQDVRPTAATTALAVIAGAGVASTWIWLLTDAIWHGSRGASLNSTLVVTIAAIGAASVLAISCAVIAGQSMADRQLTQDPVPFVVLQDQLLYLVFSGFALALPAISLAQADGNLREAIQTPSIFLGTPFFFFYAFALENNRTHLDRQRARIIELHSRTSRPSHPDSWLTTLRRHMLFQRLTTYAIATLTVVPLSVVVLGAFDKLLKLLKQSRTT
ncbi:hypothetical protein HPO96_20845 [Kribbella sandramycini]|uniref:Putative membrane protein YhdT n=1 Tax=Kribbella sandramycini TaxID=60450 RepID=A0A7Y4L1Q7_9ACTN|nr:hypothetical protein [Kribbella sandramycini]MBB6566649.1 putative membrane protein YhdT [Kribbella sandramycini]NOL42698.1 hypothetical protein [Kribbella sandramycini]